MSLTSINLRSTEEETKVEDGSPPSICRVFANAGNLDFDDARENKATEEFTLNETFLAKGQTLKLNRMRFKNVKSVTV